MRTYCNEKLMPRIKEANRHEGNGDALLTVLMELDRDLFFQCLIEA